MLQIADERLLNVTSNPLLINLAWGLKFKTFDFDNTLSIDCSNLK